MKELTDAIRKLAESQKQLAKQACEQYSPLVNNIINNGSKDVNHICYTLDFMLDFCFDEQMLMLYRRLCRHLYSIDQHAAADYVRYYRDMWDEEGVNTLK